MSKINKNGKRNFDFVSKSRVASPFGDISQRKSLFDRSRTNSSGRFA